MMDDPLEAQEFYELMQAYRLAPTVDQAAVIDAYEKVKEYIRTHFIEDVAF